MENYRALCRNNPRSTYHHNPWAWLVSGIKSLSLYFPRVRVAYGMVGHISCRSNRTSCRQVSAAGKKTASRFENQNWIPRITRFYIYFSPGVWISSSFSFFSFFVLRTRGTWAHLSTKRVDRPFRNGNSSSRHPITSLSRPRTVPLQSSLKKYPMDMAAQPTAIAAAHYALGRYESKLWEV